MIPPLRIALLTTLGRNVGDEFIREGVKAILDRVTNGYETLYIDKHDPETLCSVVEDEVGQYTDKYFDSDVFIQCGAPVYWHFFDGEARSVVSEWHDWLWVRRVLNRRAESHPWFFNLGAGSCQPWGNDGGAFVLDAECARFARLAGARAKITIVRDGLAAKMLADLNVSAVELPCPAFLAAERHSSPRAVCGAIGINLMPGGGHFKLDAEFDQGQWRREIELFLGLLRQEFKLLFVAHDEAEAGFQQLLAKGDEQVFHSRNWRDYLDVYGSSVAVVANRVHGAVCAAGFGVPSIIIGNDSRADIASYIGLPVVRAAKMESQDLYARVSLLVRERAKESIRLIDLRRATMDRYVDLLSRLAPFNTQADVRRRKIQLDANVDYYSEEVGSLGRKTIAPAKESADNRWEDFHISFASGSQVPSSLAIFGLASPETWGTWTDARLARTCTIMFPTNLPLEFELTIIAFAFGPNVGQNIGLRIGPFESKIVLNAEASEICLSVCNNGPVTSIEIVPPFPCSPRDLEGGDDERLIAVGLHSLAIRASR